MRRQIAADLAEVRAARQQIEWVNEQLQAAGRGADPVQPRAGAVRLRRLARPAGAAAQGGQLLPAAAAPLRGPARRAGRPVHRVRRRRRQADAAAHQRPAGVLPGRPDHAPASRRSTCDAVAGRRPAASSRPTLERDRTAERHLARPADGARATQPLLRQLLQNLVGNALKFRRADAAAGASSVAARRDGDELGVRRAATTASASSRSTPTRSS